MRILKLEASGFRAFTSRVELDLSADVVVVHGDNGSGKTSLFDGVLWCLTGEIRRFARSPRTVSSLFGSGEETFVRLTLGDSLPELTVTRSAAGEISNVVVEDGQGRVSGPAAEVQLLRRLWPAGLDAQSPLTTLSLVLARSVYLQQDAVRDFVVTDKDDQRFEILSELVGAGRISELERTLASSRHSWSLATSERKPDLDRLVEQVGRLRLELDRLWTATEDEGALTRAIDEWRIASRGALGGDLDPERSVESALLRMRADLAKQTTRLNAAALIEAHLEAAPTLSKAEALELVKGRALLEERRVALANAQRYLSEAQAQASASRAAALEAREHHESLRVFASLALQHLGESCPVCQQRYDVASTRARLESVAGSNLPEETIPERVGNLAKESAQLEGVVRQLDARVRELEGKRIAAENWRAQLATQLLAIDMYQIPENVSEVVSLVGATAEREAARLRALVESGDELVIRLRRVAESSSRKSLTTQLEARTAELTDLQSWHRRRQETYESATQMISQIREASFDAVALQLEGMEPVVSRIFARMGSHPVLTRVLLRALRATARGRVSISVGDSNV
ncbi:MAG: AAA family ATPase, partial [Actinomycetota bacterium]|nr:AAA family ATPase [Actinomycetota bacterium]